MSNSGVNNNLTLQVFLRWVVGLVVVAAIGAALWYFRQTVVYILVSAVFAIVGRPLVGLLSRIKVKRFLFPRWLAAAITLVLLWVVIGGLLSLFVGNILPCIYIIMLLNRHSKVCNQTWVPFVFVYICICVLKTQVPIFYRFLNYFEILVIVAYTNVLFYEKLKIKRQLASVFMFLMVLVRMYSLTSNDVDTTIPAYYRYVPYNSIFQQNYNKNSEIIFSN